ncbi:DNA replication and repair protein RecO [Paenimyroides aquimaris]|uniref:DNA repair protein RecO n=1 Tax=Paenimyroides marinum TaxID=1159016 RepID=A0A1H6JMJ2_9FLAO|nr:DNA repair protein RecO [Paenimyroides aquimaris]SEH61751.1 DNA replication and repair protein RecO [Paenimyroides aquimaris]
MQVKTEAVVLSALRYQEKSLVVRCFTRDFGLKTYFIRNAFSAKNKSLNSAYFQPLNLLFIDAVHKNKGSLEYINELKLMYPYTTISLQFYKNSVSIFLAEILSHAVKEEQPNNEFFLFLKTTLIWFDEHEFYADFHLWFLLKITKYLGFYPDDSDKDSLYFNPNEGSFTMQYTPNCFNEDETDLFRKVFKLSLTEKRIHLTNTERKTLLKLLLLYFETHIVGFKPVKSIEILSELF